MAVVCGIVKHIAIQFSCNELLSIFFLFPFFILFWNEECQFYEIVYVVFTVGRVSVRCAFSFSYLFLCPLTKVYQQFHQRVKELQENFPSTDSIFNTQIYSRVKRWSIRQFRTMSNTLENTILNCLHLARIKYRP